MSEVHIRINKRFIERAVFLLVIIGLVVALVLFQPTVVDSADELAELREEVASLQAQNQQLQTQLEVTQEELEVVEEEVPETTPEPEPAPEPEQTLSGVLDVTYDFTVSGGALQAFIVSVDNGLNRIEEVTARVNWVGGNLGEVYRLKSAFVNSGSRANIIIDDLPSRPGDGITSIRVVVRNANDEVVDQDTIRVL